MSSSTDYIIVGQGLAGTLLAHKLIEEKKRVLIINTNLPAMSSKVAAGIINPVAVKRCIKSWNIDLYLPYAIQYYKQLEKKLSSKFLKISSIYRLFSSLENRKTWQIKCSNTNISKYINHIYTDSQYSFLKDSLGGASILPAGRLEVEKFLNISKEYICEKATYISDQFDYSCLNLDNSIYRSTSFNKIIFCEGFRMLDNPYFNYLPLRPTKGEMLLINIPNLRSIDKIFSKDIWFMQLKPFHFLVGATFQHQAFDDKPTEDGVAYLKSKLNNMLSIEYKIINVLVGVRPTTKDRKPLIGLHKTYKNLAVFNGFGSKGVVQGPFLTANFVNFLTKGQKLMEDIDIQRFRL